ncbi:MAG: hypothetical protein ISS55_03560 [Dehalococcoidales bacterium]|nr:hypothetical protein [Dehalococcoidales bacterium]
MDSLPRAILLDLDDMIVALGALEESWLAVCREFAPKVNIGVERLLVCYRSSLL